MCNIFLFTGNSIKTRLKTQTPLTASSSMVVRSLYTTSVYKQNVLAGSLNYKYRSSLSQWPIDWTKATHPPTTWPTRSCKNMLNYMKQANQIASNFISVKQASDPYFSKTIPTSLLSPESSSIQFYRLQ